jgi:hypothetical protein
MKSKALLLTAALGLTGALALASNILEFDFSGSASNSTSNEQFSTFSLTGIQTSTMTRGSDIGNNNANNSFRGQGFSNLGIDIDSDRYFKFDINADQGYTFSISSIYGNYNGTATYSNSPGVTMAFAYSLDGSSYTLMDNFTQVGSGNQTFMITGNYASALSDISFVSFKLFASGQTSTGGWGLQSAASPGTLGLSVQGTAIPEPGTLALIGISALILYFRRRMKA